MSARKRPIRPEQYAFYTNGDIEEVLLLLRHRSSKLAFIKHVIRSNTAGYGGQRRSDSVVLAQARAYLTQYGL